MSLTRICSDLTMGGQDATLVQLGRPLPLTRRAWTEGPWTSYSRTTASLPARNYAVLHLLRLHLRRDIVPYALVAYQRAVSSAHSCEVVSESDICACPPIGPWKAEPGRLPSASHEFPLCLLTGLASGACRIRHPYCPVRSQTCRSGIKACVVWVYGWMGRAFPDGTHDSTMLHGSRAVRGGIVDVDARNSRACVNLGGTNLLPSARPSSRVTELESATVRGLEATRMPWSSIISVTIRTRRPPHYPSSCWRARTVGKPT
ncbi:hypothetical protein CALVIDRAFT_188734 [Calocera viscosa TUFC12733]|uniref:Uncharacterized protein n=1 Tax=Calocera viscosa (strain TUFC12733) TaxID=1330018 RepID=A0A167KW78_CALVF|nr:hypothetical protein CALVIDRAFT_188734 [Calocera viscosa TUFC12733]